MSEVLLSHADRLELWHQLKHFEQLYGYPSASRYKAFIGIDGRLQHDEDYEEWSECFVAWKIATRSEFIPECIDTHDLETAARLAREAEVATGSGMAVA